MSTLDDLNTQLTLLNQELIGQRDKLLPAAEQGPIATSAAQTAVAARDQAQTAASLAKEISGLDNVIGAVNVAFDVSNPTLNPLQSLDLTQDATGAADGCWKFGSLSGNDKWFGGVLAPNGKIYGIPANSTQVLEIDPVTQTATLFGSLSGSFKWYGGVLAPNGKIYGIPANSTQVLEIDPVTQTTTLFGSLSGTGKWFGGVLAPNGKIYGIPRNSTQVLDISKGMNGGNYWALSAYVNKF